MPDSSPESVGLAANIFLLRRSHVCMSYTHSFGYETEGEMIRIWSLIVVFDDLPRSSVFSDDLRRTRIDCMAVGYMMDSGVR